MKQTKRETRFEHKEIILVLHEDDGSQHTKSVAVYKREKGAGKREESTSQWKGDLNEVSHLAEAIALLGDHLGCALGPERERVVDKTMLECPQELPDPDKVIVTVLASEWRELLDEANRIIAPGAPGDDGGMALAQRVNAIFGGKSAGILPDALPSEGRLEGFG